MDKDFHEIVEEVYQLFLTQPIENQRSFASERREALTNYQIDLGRPIRNTYNLWERQWEPEIVDVVDYSPNHPDQMSMRVIEAVWERANKAYK